MSPVLQFKYTLKWLLPYCGKVVFAVNHRLESHLTRGVRLVHFAGIFNESYPPAGRVHPNPRKHL